MNKLRTIFTRKTVLTTVLIALTALFTLGNSGCDTQETKDSKIVNSQQSHLRKVHPLRFYDYSRELAIYQQIYDARNLEVVTHSVWRSNYGIIEGDCPCLGFPIPYDVQMTNPLRTVYRGSGSVIEQAEPNGLFSSKNTAATWVPCANSDGTLSPIYVESKVTSYPYPVTVNYETNRVQKVPDVTPSVKIKVDIKKLKELSKRGSILP